MAHFAKYAKATCGQMLSHYDREKEKIGNENVHRERSYLNYNLAPDHHMSQGAFIRKRCSEVRCQNRKDVNVLCDWIVTIPKDFLSEHPEREREFFEQVYSFLESRYGSQNVVSAYVHRDEITPHIHFAFVPVVPDKKRNGYKVSAKEAVTRSDLKRFHVDLSKYLKQQMGLEINILNGATAEGNKSIDELKRQSARERLEKATEEASKIVSEAQKAAQGIKDKLVPVKAEYEANKAFLSEMKRASAEMYPAEVKISEKGLVNKRKIVSMPAELWEARYISSAERSCIQKEREAVDQILEEVRKSMSGEQIKSLNHLIDSLTKRLSKLENEKTELQDLIMRQSECMSNQDELINQLKETLKESREERDEAVGDIMARLNKTLVNLPEGIRDLFVEEWYKKSNLEVQKRVQPKGPKL